MPSELANIQRRLYFILHRGLIETRNLALSDRRQQIHDLADTLEFLPSEMNNWKADSLETIRQCLEAYQHKYSGDCYEYSKYLGQEDPPASF